MLCLGRTKSGGCDPYAERRSKTGSSRHEMTEATTALLWANEHAQKQI
jgi:hypothetical protein